MPVKIQIPQSRSNAIIELTINSTMYDARLSRVTIDLNGNANEDQTLVVTLVNPERYPNRQFSSVVLDIKLFSQDDVEVTEFKDQPVKLCFSSYSNDKKDNCLSYFSAKSLNWECEDSCVDEQDDNFYCGNTDHFTNFALLLGATEEDECDDVNYVISYLSLAFIIVAILLVISSIAVIEFKVRYKTYQFDKELTKRTTGQRSLQ